MPAVFLSGEHNITFVHIPKTAGTSIGHWLKDVGSNSFQKDWYDHPSIEMIRAECGTNFSFAVVRNPWDLFVSVYHDLQNPNKLHKDYDNNYWKDFVKDSNQYDEWPSFDEWLSTIKDFKLFPDAWWSVTTQQTAWIKSGVDLVIKMEELDSKFSIIQEMLNSNKPLGIENTTSHLHYREYYSNQSKEIIERLCKDDISRWGYTF